MRAYSLLLAVTVFAGVFAGCATSNGAHVDGGDSDAQAEGCNVPDRCGVECTPCPGPGPLQANMVRVCEAGFCGLACADGFYDLDLDVGNGCEDSCPADPLATPDPPDDLFIDANCDGIDGVAANGLFVAEDGSNTNSGTREAPLATITFALDKAETEGKSSIFVAAGNYAESVTMKPGIGIHGGYLRDADWTRDGTRGVIIGDATGAVRAIDIDMATTLEYMEIRSANATVPSTSSHAIVAVDSSAFVPRYLLVQPGNGAAGLSGASAGQIGDDGGDGTVGYSGYEDDGYFYCDGDKTDPPTNQSGGDACVGASNRGGNGGRGCKTNDSAGCAGAAGDPGAGTGGGAGGIAAVADTGGSGTSGWAGAPGSMGSAGSNALIIDNQWVPNAGGDGGTGDPGGGGGGGAGGGSDHDTGTCNDWGGGGGSGGGGGCGGTGGDGGGGGGASIGILLVNSKVNHGAAVDVTAGDGGDGGSGRDGGDGGPGGEGKGGGSGYDEGLSGGTGRDGGTGGAGGAGGGGAGGWSICVYVDPDSSWVNEGVPAYNVGSVGSGGISAGNDGVVGSAVTVFSAGQ